MFFNKKIKNYRISSVDQKVGYFKKLEVDFLINKTFNKQFSKITCHKFIKEILSKELKAKYIFVSNNFRFGYRREGDVKLLKYYQSICDYKLINPKPLKKNKKIISSTYIRKLLEQGNLDKANAKYPFEDGSGKRASIRLALGLGEYIGIRIAALRLRLE